MYYNFIDGCSASECVSESDGLNFAIQSVRINTIYSND